MEQLDRLRRAHLAQRHRGPDGDGWLAYAPAAGVVSLEGEAAPRIEHAVATRPTAARVILGHRRLAVIDLSPAGRQPMGMPDGNRWIAFNGEIYNYRELRHDLEHRGRSFRSNSDTEVLLHAVHEWRADALRRLVGMFAFVLLDTVAGRLFLARDPFGQKPLYYHRHATGISFASEMRALLEVIGGRATARPSVVFDLLARGATDHRPETMFEGIDALPPGHWIDLDLERATDVRAVPYWELHPPPVRAVPFEEAVEEVRGRFFESVALHMRSDVGIGTLLSGGIDSSSIVMAMRRIGRETLDLHTFSYIGQGDARSEEPWIDSVNTAARAVPHMLRLDPAEWSRSIDEVTAVYDEPIGSLAIYAQHQLFRLAADAGVKVLLDGQGGDELLAGYRGTWALRLAGLLRRGRWVAAARFLARLRGARGPADPSAARTLRGAVRANLPAWRRSRVARWLDREWFRARGVVRVHPLLDQVPRTVHEALVLSTRAGLPALLRWEDRSGMASSIEGRLPFLTPALAETFLALPDTYLVGANGTNKYVFREAMRGVVPDNVVDRYEKIGFSVPHRDWMRALPDLAKRLDGIREVPCLDRSVAAMIESALRNPSAANRAHTFEFWRIIGFANWVRVFDVAFP